MQAKIEKYLICIILSVAVKISSRLFDNAEMYLTMVPKMKYPCRHKETDNRDCLKKYCWNQMNLKDRKNSFGKTS